MDTHPETYDSVLRTPLDTHPERYDSVLKNLSQKDYCECHTSK